MSETETKSSSSSRGFWSLIVTQFQNAFSDNALRNLVIFLIVGAGLSAAERDRMILLIGMLFSMPFILFSMAGGFLADRFSKRLVTIGTKLSELPLMLLAMAGLAANSQPALLAAVFLMGVRSALFGPAKYGLLPELLAPKRLSWGNGVLELGTFVAIILGTVAGGWLCETFRGRQLWSGVALLAVAVVGLITSFGVSRVPAADPAKKFHVNFLADLFAQVRLISGDRVLWLAVLGNTYFWFLGMLLQLNIVFLGTDALHISATQINAVVPYELAGRVETSVWVSYRGQTSNSVPLPVVTTAPGIYTLNQSGSGPGATWPTARRWRDSPTGTGVKTCLLLRPRKSSPTSSRRSFSRTSSFR